MTYNHSVDDFLGASNIEFCAANVEGGERFYLVKRSEVLRVLNYCKRQHPENLSSLKQEGRRLVLGRDDLDFITGPGVRFDDTRCVILFCDLTPEGRWVSRYKNSPISRITAPTVAGGAFKDGVFLTNRSIAFKSEDDELRLRDQNDNRPVDQIDVVYTWVDSSDPRWMVKKAMFSENATLNSGDHSYRYLSRDELKYSIRSIAKYAPWVRNIYIVTDEQKPDWLRVSSKVRVIDHREIFPDPSVLPVFNSHAIESCLHRIPELSEFFIYFNDDVFLGRPVKPTHFFDDVGRSLVYISQASFIDPTIPPELQVPTDVAAYNMQALVKRDFGFTPTRKMMHTPHPLRKSVMEEICDLYPEQIEITRKARVRSATDLAVPSMFYPYFAWATGRAVLRKPGSTKYRYFDTGKSDFRLAVSAITKDPPHFFCANVTYHEEIDTVEQAKILTKMFKTLYPTKSKVER
jgi:Protein of unknown function (DUF3184).